MRAPLSTQVERRRAPSSDHTWNLQHLPELHTVPGHYRLSSHAVIRDVFCTRYPPLPTEANPAFPMQGLKIYRSRPGCIVFYRPKSSFWNDRLSFTMSGVGDERRFTWTRSPYRQGE